MTDDPDLAKLARDFMDLWQEQIAAAATDPALAKWTEAWMTGFSTAIGAVARDGGAGAPGPEAPIAPPDDVLRRLDEFAARLDACERRLAAVERKARPRAGPIQTAIEAAAADRLAGAVHREATRRMADFVAGIKAYRGHPYRRGLADPEPVWAKGSARLRDYGGRGRPVLFIPSLINRSYILDLQEDNSLLRDLKARGLRPLLMDWGAPGADEAGFALDDYIMDYLCAALDAAVALAEAPVPVAGYCMGGLLALALARHRARDIASLALLATPWDFHADRTGQAGLFALALPQVDAAERTDGLIPVDVLQTMFATMSPNLIQAKFRRFAGLDPASAEAVDFVALEDWLNDGVPLTGPVGRDCLKGWYGDNRPGLGHWRVGGVAVVPEEIALPALVAVPRRDHIVPPQSARPLADRLPNTRLLEPAAGHIGMVVGRHARGELLGALTDWFARAA